MKILLYIYGIMSLITLIAYAIDKNAAIRWKWRIRKITQRALLPKLMSEDRR